MDQHTPYGTRRPRSSAHSGPGHAIALAVVAALCLLLWAATVPRIGAAITQTGRPGYDAQVVSCPQPGGFVGRCEISVTRDGQDVRTRLADPGLMIPETGDRLTVTLDQDGTARPGGWRPWVTVALLTGLSLFMTRATITRMKEAMLAYAVDDDSDDLGLRQEFDAQTAQTSTGRAANEPGSPRSRSDQDAA
ncbi:hypothetical protein [Austwickia chelonae]|uniref:hypothetical protein n=1 Tax=Austwickia chelonae TaxID=100225 RepID=UPI0013C329C9|nr:hypothetical protein [Austwickia chelonae]